jgi:sarcosine oxidase / L-pipecolate oxidase
MSRKQLKPLDKIIIVGAGAFGLSTALHLVLRGYKNVTVCDRHNYDTTRYDYLSGADSASSDLNKIIRSAYGSQTEYQELSKEALEWWTAWNEEIASGKDLPSGLKSSDKVFINNGVLAFTDKDELPAFEVDTVRSMEAAGRGGTQLITTEPKHIEQAERIDFAHGIDPFRRKARGKTNVGVLDTTGGVVVADKACRFVLHKARTLGVKFILDAKAGAFKSFQYNSSNKVTGIITEDDRSHFAHKIIMCCGGYTPSLIPDLDGLCETTAGSVIMMKIPPVSPLYSRFAPENFPAWMWRLWDGVEGGLYGFPRDDRGWMKIGYRGKKFVNPVRQEDGKERSVPVTRYTSGEKVTRIPLDAMRVFKGFLNKYLPELAKEGIKIDLTRLCWYTDSFDNHYLVDYLPNQENVMIATGGSGHAFKYLPNLGKWIVDVMEEKGMERTLVQRWKWRELRKGEVPFNRLMEGKGDNRALGNVKWCKDSDLVLGSTPKL